MELGGAEEKRSSDDVAAATRAYREVDAGELREAGAPVLGLGPSGAAGTSGAEVGGEVFWAAVSKRDRAVSSRVVAWLEAVRP